MRVNDIEYSLFLLLSYCKSSLIFNWPPHLWRMVYYIAINQGVLALAWDGVLRHEKENNERVLANSSLRINWALNTEYIEKKYEKQKNVIVFLTRFFAAHGINVMILKGYGLSLNYPIPEHRPCGDIDIWLFRIEKDTDGKTVITNVQREADALLHQKLNVDISEDVHHHTVFYFEGVFVENHYNFLNVHAHISNRIIENRLQELVRESMVSVQVCGETLYLPSVDFNVLFLLRHTASHFAAESIGLRHLLDWKYFIEKNASDINWDSMEHFAEDMNMHRFMHCINGICIDYLGMMASLIPTFERESTLEQRVLSDIFSPEFDEAKPHNAYLLSLLIWKFRRWWANRWKHRIVYREGLLSTFFVQLRSHLIKPETLKLH